MGLPIRKAGIYPLVGALVLLCGCNVHGSSPTPATTSSAANTPGASTPAQEMPTAEATATAETESTPSKAASSSPSTSRSPDFTSPDSLTVLVNKMHPLSPKTYAPVDLVPFGGVYLRQEAAQAAEEMFAAASVEGVGITALSGYRSYETQVGTYNSWVATYGQEQADVASARPGYSEHQTGLALDIGTGGACDVQVCFKDTDAARWSAAHAHEYGFVLRYPWWQHETTGYWYESWHFRYVGRAEAAAFHSSGAPTLEDFWGFALSSSE